MDVEDLFHAHIGGVDVLARAILNAAEIIEDGTLDYFVTERYAGWDDAFGQNILTGVLDLADTADHAVFSNSKPKAVSGRQEFLENLINNFC